MAGNASPAGASMNSHCTVGAKVPATISRLHSGSEPISPQGTQKPLASSQKVSPMHSSSLAQVAPVGTHASRTQTSSAPQQALAQGVSQGSAASPPSGIGTRASTPPVSGIGAHIPSRHRSPALQSSALVQVLPTVPPQSQPAARVRIEEAKRSETANLIQEAYSGSSVGAPERCTLRPWRSRPTSS